MSENPGARDPSWHDNLIYGLHLQGADPEAGRWQSNLILDIDHIVEWVCGTAGRPQFRVAPATLIFTNVTDLRIRLDFGGGDHQETMNELSIACIAKKPSALRSAVGPVEYYQWRIELNLPERGEIAFGASRYTQTLRAEPVLLDEQRLLVGSRPHLVIPNSSVT